MAAGVLDGMRAWLRKPAIADPLDRRHASTLQSLLLALLILLPLSWAWRLTTGDASTHALVINSVLLLCSVLALLLVRRGQFRAAVLLFLSAFHLLLIIGYAETGLIQQFPAQVPHAIGILLAALLAGRRTLWCMFALVLLGLAAGVWTDVAAGRTEVWQSAPRTALSFLLITALLDRFALVSRDLLQREQRRAEELAAAHAQLGSELLNRERLQLALHSAERARNTEIMSAGMAHELNNVLARVYARLFDTEARLQPSDIGAETTPLAPLRETLDEAAGRIARILELVRGEELPLALVSPRGLLQSVLGRLQAALPLRTELHVHSAEVGLIKLVPTDFAQLVLLLFEAGAEAVPAHEGRLDILLGERELRGRPGCSLRVRDNGPPLAAADLLRPGGTLFAHGGPGAGGRRMLAWTACRALAERYGGQLLLQRHGDSGTEAEVWLPYPEETQVAGTHPMRSVDPQRVLLVDDDPDVCGLLTLVLERAGFAVEVAQSAAEARARREGWGHSLPLLVMDRNLPDGDGVSLLEEFARDAAGLRAVFSSVQALRDQDRERLLGIRLQELSKPYPPERMVVALQALSA